MEAEVLVRAAGIDDYLPKPVTTALRNAASVPQRLRAPGRVRGLVLSLNVARLDLQDLYC